MRISDVNIVDVSGRRIIPRQDILIADGRIVDISDHPNATKEHSRNRFFANGGFAVAGLYDAHTHIDTAARLELMLPEVSGTPVTESDIDDDLVPYMAYGVTGIVELSGSKEVLEARDRARKAGAFLPRILSASPILDGPDSGNPVHLKVSDPAEGIAAVNEAASAGHDLIKIYGKLDIETRKAIIQRAGELGLPVTGHLPESPGFDETIVSGFSNIAHAEEITRFWDGNDRQYLAHAIGLMAAGNVSLTPNLVAYREIADELEDLEAHLASMDWALTPPLARVYASRQFNGYLEDFGADDVRERAIAYFRRLGLAMDGLALEAHKSGVLLLAGSDTGNPTMFAGQGLYRELTLLKGAGLDGFDALAAATLNVAKLFGEDNERGSIETGKIADIVLFDVNPVEVGAMARENVLAVIKDGVLFDRDRISREISRVRGSYDERESRYRDLAKRQ